MADEQTRMGFVGLGTMGEAMATVLIEAGHNVVVWNRSPDAVSRLVDMGATAATTVGDALATGLAFSILSNEQAVFDVFSEYVLGRWRSWKLETSTPVGSSS